MSRERASRQDFPDRYIVNPLGPFEPPPVTAWFDTPRPLEVDLGCGRGRFLLARAARFPNVNFVGIDRLLLRLHKLDLKIVQGGIPNIRLVRGDAAETCRRLFPTSSVSAFYVLFADPWPKRKHQRRRMMSPQFVDLLHQILVPRGLLHVATDHQDYFTAVDTLLSGDLRFERVPPFEPTEEEQTDFEVIFRSQQLPICRCSFSKKG